MTTKPDSTTSSSTNVSSLKSEYTLRKQLHEHQKLTDVVELLESHVLILEKLDTQSIERVIDAMNAIEQGLAPFTAQVPAFKQALDAAEADLTSLVSGKAGNDPKKVNATLGKALALYQGLSEFFRQDLPVLMKSKLFAPAKAQGQTGKPMGAVPGLNVNNLTNAFVQALAIRKTGGFLQKLITSSNLPYVDNKALAQQLVGLSYDNLVKLSGLSKMPALADQASIQQAASAVVSNVGGGGAVSGTQTAATATTSPPSATGSPTGTQTPPTASAGTGAQQPATAMFGGKNPVESQLVQAIDKAGGVDAIAKLINSKQITDSGTLARLIAQIAAK
jgi:hypothetical protein